MNHNKTKQPDQGGCNYCGSVAHRTDCPSRKYNDFQGQQLDPAIEELPVKGFVELVEPKSEPEKCATCGHDKAKHDSGYHLMEHGRPDMVSVCTCREYQPASSTSQESPSDE